MLKGHSKRERESARRREKERERDAIEPSSVVTTLSDRTHIFHFPFLTCVEVTTKRNVTKSIFLICLSICKSCSDPSSDSQWPFAKHCFSSVLKNTKM